MQLCAKRLVFLWLLWIFVNWKFVRSNCSHFESSAQTDFVGSSKIHMVWGPNKLGFDAGFLYINISFNVVAWMVLITHGKRKRRKWRKNKLAKRHIHAMQPYSISLLQNNRSTIFMYRGIFTLLKRKKKYIYNVNRENNTRQSHFPPFHRY